MTNKVNTIIFDFDGVIANSGEIFIESLQEVLKRQPFTEQEIDELRSLGTRQIVKKLGVRKWQLPRVVIKGRRLIAQKMDRVNMFEGIDKAIKDLDKAGYNILILSSGDRAAIENFLIKHGLDKQIKRVYHGTSLYGKAKALKSLMKKEGLDKESCVYVGDETRDIEAAKEVNMHCIAVEWGYAHASALKASDPTTLIKTPKQLPGAVKSAF